MYPLCTVSVLQVYCLLRGPIHQPIRMQWPFGRPRHPELFIIRMIMIERSLFLSPCFPVSPYKACMTNFRFVGLETPDVSECLACALGRD